MQKHKNGTITGILLPMGLVCLFAFCSLALALLGGRAYRQIQGGVDDSFSTTVAASYLHTKISSAEGEVFLRQEDGTQVLVIASMQGDVAYETRIWFSGEALLEVFEHANSDFVATSGIKVADLAGCAFSLKEGMFEAELTSPAGTVTQTACALGGGV